MRKIKASELSNDLNNAVVIKRREWTHYRKMSDALERTLRHCQKISTEKESEAVALREASQKAGFAEGFRLFFEELAHMLDEYDRLQDQRFSQYRQKLLDAVQCSLRDPAIVELIIQRLKEQNGQQKVIRIIVPHGVELPMGNDSPNYHFVNSDNITLQNENDAIRFPAEHLHGGWRKKADDDLSSVHHKIHSLVPDIYSQIAKKLLELSTDRGNCHHEKAE